jgi:RNA polymerase sigma factor (sigma-70 family)
LLTRIPNDDGAFAELVTRYLPVLSSLAGRRAGPELAAVVDPESLALRTLLKFRQSARNGGAARQVADRTEFVHLLLAIAAQRVLRARRHHTRKCRDVRRTVRDADAPQSAGEAPLWEALPGREPSPDWDATYADTLAAYLAGLSPQHRRMVRLRLDGLEHAEIAVALDCSVRTVERQLAAARRVLEDRIRVSG